MPKYTTRLENDPLADALDITPRPSKEITVRDNAEVDYLEKTDDQKFKESHDGLKKLIDTGEAAVEELSSVAYSSQHARDYEVLSGLIKTLVDANKQLVENEKMKVDIEAKKGKLQPQNPTINQNNLIVGSTEEALELLAKQKEMANDE